jgi:hypothetical protein
VPFGCTIDLRSNNEPSRSQASLACGKACQSRQASQRMSVGPGSRIRALSMPEFSSFRRLRRARPRCGSKFVRPIVGALTAADRGVRCTVSRRTEPVGCLPLPIVGAVFSAGVRGIGCVFIRPPGILHGVFLSFAESESCYLPFDEPVPCFSAVRGVRCVRR